jgi:copper(I)-binding protein
VEGGDGASGDARVRVVRAIVVAPAPGAPAALYATITNSTGRLDSLLGLATPEADSVRLHRQMKHGAMMRMTPVHAIPLPPGGDVALSPGGLHGMLYGHGPALARGDTIPVVFRFSRTVETVAAPVVSYAELDRALAAPGPAGP